MKKLAREDVTKLARLSRLRLTDQEIEKLQTELAEILDYVKVLDGVDTSGLEPTYQITGLKNVTRADKPHDYGANPSELLKNAPDTMDGQFKVKRVLG